MVKSAPMKCERCGLVHGLDGFRLGIACFVAMQGRIAALEAIGSVVRRAADSGSLDANLIAEFDRVLNDAPRSAP